jgi:hypothetical protein
MERFSAQGSAAVGTNKTLINLFNQVASPTKRGGITDIIMGCAATPADQATKFYIGRTTALGTEASGYVPNNVDPGGPTTGEYDAGIAHTVEPTYTANKELLVFSMNQRATFRWVAAPNFELLMAATQNYGAGLKSASSTGTAVHDACILFTE